ncbi:hypothetical protein BH10BDE1_BH10BDE1_20290 [soil metagenome]
MKNAQRSKKYAAVFLVTAFAAASTMGCSKLSSVAVNGAGTDHSGQSVPAVAPIKGINPALKAYGTSINELTGLLGIGGRLLDVVADPASPSINISIYLPPTVLFLAQTYLSKYPQIQTSVLTDAAGKSSLNLKVSVADAAAAYKKWNDKKRAEEVPVPSVPSDPTQPSNPSVPSYKGGCNGTYAGNIDPPEHDVRIASRNQSLTDRGIPITGDDAIDNAATGGGGVDGGIYLQGTFQWETDANCNVTSGEVVIFGYPFAVSGAVNADGTFDLYYWGRIPGKIGADKKVSGKVQHAGGEEHIHGVLNGVFTAR